MLPLILLLPFIYGLNAEIEDLSQVICKDASVGDIVPNPHDCNSYFVCETVPLISFCAPGLHFDAKNRVCNWPELAKCKLKESFSLTEYTSEPVVNASAAKVFSNHISGPILEPKPARDSTAETPLDPEFISFIALNVNTHKPIDPMEGYDSKNVACKHYGAYFLPHPTDCNLYYMCAFGHMLQHKCGRGTGWNYKRQVCEIRPLTECYASSATVQMNKVEPAPETLAEFSTEQLIDTPPTDGIYTVCYVLDNGVAGRPTWVPQEATTQPNSSPAPIVTWQPTRTPPSLVTVSSTSRELSNDLVIPICPEEDKVYLAHSSDCSKYYICIIGMPVLTSCPEGLYWNPGTEFCDSPMNVECSKKRT